MKLIALFAVLALSFAAQAEEATPVTGAEAASIVNILENHGAQGDAAAGSYWVGVTNVSCGSTKAEGSASCSIVVDNQMGKSFTKSLDKASSQIILDSMIGAGIGGCGMESCNADVKNIDCSTPNDPEFANGATCHFSN